jgi:hypothetical protein
MATPTLNIGLVAYHCTGNLAFVRVPSERGRYMLTDLCVIAVACPMCGAVIGEPCRSGSWHNGEPSPRWASRPSVNGHGCSVHVARKSAADAKYGRGWKRTVLAHYKLHLGAGDIEAALSDAPAPSPPEELADIDFPVTRKEGR